MGALEILKLRSYNVFKMLKIFENFNSKIIELMEEKTKN